VGALARPARHLPAAVGARCELPGLWRVEARAAQFSGKSEGAQRL